MKKTLSLILVLAMVAALFFGCEKTEPDDSTSQVDVYAAYTFRELPEPKYITAAEDFAGGSGTEKEPYQISNAAELALLSKKIINEEDDFIAANYILTADIALNDVSNFDSWATDAPEYSWEPIGSTSIVLTFNGVLDGQGHTVSGLYINTNFDKESSQEHSEADYGLFGCLNGTIKNINIEKSFFEISGVSSNIGSFAGRMTYSARIENCSSNAVIRCYYANCGGIAGETDGGATMHGSNEYAFSEIKNCTFSGTIDMMQEKSLSYIGGIAGYNWGKIDSCINEGTLNFTDQNINNAGGITGTMYDGSISNCKNKGSLLCKSSGETNYVNVGGIAGHIAVSSTGYEEDKGPDGISLTGCENSGIVEGPNTAGGIVGVADNSSNNLCIKIKDCVNTGTVSSVNHCGGIVAQAYCSGENKGIEFENCENKADISDGTTVGGIAGTVIFSSGELSYKNCVNSGNLSTSDQNCAGIIAYMTMSESLKNSTILIENCKNDGDVSTNLNAGGIISYMNLLNGDKVGKNVNFSIKNCENNGKITSASINSYIGGILGVFGAANVPTVIDNCRNNGTLSITALDEMGDEEAASTPTLSKIAGGIVGRVGAALLLSTDSDSIDEKYVQAKKPVLRITNCSNKGALDITKSDAANIKNWFGGIIGNASAEKYFSFNVSNCTFANFERGLGNEEFADVGQKTAS